MIARKSRKFAKPARQIALLSGSATMRSCPLLVLMCGPTPSRAEPLRVSWKSRSRSPSPS